MSSYPIFLSVILMVRNRQDDLPQVIAEIEREVAPLASDYEIVVVDNASGDDSVAVLRRLTGEGGVPNLQVYALTKAVDDDTAWWAGLENSLGDFMVVIDPSRDDPAFIGTMLEASVGGADVVFASNQQKLRRSLAHRVAFHAFHAAYTWLTGVNLAREAPPFRVLSRRVVNLILQYPQPAIAYRHLPASGGFSRVNLVYRALRTGFGRRDWWARFDRAMRLIVSTTRIPMRLVTGFFVAGSALNLAATAWLAFRALAVEHVLPGWLVLSLQQSAMFFLAALVLAMFGEYILQIVSLSDEGPLYHVAQEFTSAHMARREKLNVEVVAVPSAGKGA